MNLMNKPPLGLKADRPLKAAGRRHMARVAQLPCVCCGVKPVTVHHCIAGRFSQRKASDFDTIPLCFECHLGPTGIHRNRAEWEKTYGLDTDFLPVVADMLAGEWTP